MWIVPLASTTATRMPSPRNISVFAEIVIASLAASGSATFNAGDYQAIGHSQLFVTPSHYPSSPDATDSDTKPFLVR